MEVEWVVIALEDVAWIFLAFVLGFIARSVSLPPLVGYLIAGVLLNAFGIANGELLQKLADLGITLLLFTVGLKLNLSTLAKPQVWAVSALHMSIVTATLGIIIYGLVLIGLPFFSDLDLRTSFLIAFSLSFSSTVFAVKVLEEKGEMTSLHGRIAIGILIMQDIAAVGFLAVSTGKLPTIWALSLLLLIPARSLLHLLLKHVGHGELLVLYGLLLALGGAEIFGLVGLKGDLGALILGIMISSHPKAEEMAKTMLGFKDLFLLGFFLSVGLSGQLSLQTFAIGVLLVTAIFLKSAFFFLLLSRFKLRARTSLLTTLNLTNFSEFGLIIVAIGVANQWLESKWLISLSIALALSFIIAAIFNTLSDLIYTRFIDVWRRFQSEERITEDRFLDIGGAKVVIIGMGGVGSGAYDVMHSLYGNAVIGVDIDPRTVSNHQNSGRHVLLGDPTDTDFWDRVQSSHTVELVMLALPKLNTSLAILHHLGDSSFVGKVATTAKFPDEVEELKAAGATTVFNIYTEAGTGFASHVSAEISGL